MKVRINPSKIKDAFDRTTGEVRCQFETNNSEVHYGIVHTLLPNFNYLISDIETNIVYVINIKNIIDIDIDT